MLVFFGAALAGVLTTLAPCVLPMLPVIVGGSAVGNDDRRLARRRAYVITGSLAASIVAFTLLLKATTALIDVPAETWQLVSGGILVVLGVVTVFPALWEAVAGALHLQARTSRQLGRANQREGFGGQILTGAALGPVFSSCSPMYGYVIVTVLPADFGRGLALLVAYCAGLAATLLVVALIGQRAIRRVGWVSDGHGRLRRAVGIVFVLVGVGVIFGWDKSIQAWVIEHAPFAPWELDKGFIPDDAS